MKFIVNSEYFRKRIEEGLAQGSNWFETSHDDLIFSAGPLLKVSFQVHPVVRAKVEEIFEPEKWQKVADFLKQIPEQPITVDLSYEQIEIYSVIVLRLKGF